MRKNWKVCEIATWKHHSMTVAMLKKHSCPLVVCSVGSWHPVKRGPYCRFSFQEKLIRLLFFLMAAEDNTFITEHWCATEFYVRLKKSGTERIHSRCPWWSSYEKCAIFKWHQHIIDDYTDVECLRCLSTAVTDSNIMEAEECTHEHHWTSLNELT